MGERVKTFTLVAYPSVGENLGLSLFPIDSGRGRESRGGGVPRFARLRVNCKVMTRGEKKTKRNIYSCTGLSLLACALLVFEKRPA